MVKKITGLQVQQKNHQRLSVFLDGEFAFGLNRIVAAWLRVGQDISDEKIAQLRAEDAREQAYLFALHYLDYRPRSTAEIRKHLLEHEIPEEEIAGVLERLQNNGLVDDTRFAEAWIENRNEFRPRGRRALAYELRLKGVDPQTIQETLDGLDEESLAYQAGLKKARMYKNLDWPDFRVKLSGFLARRGFGYDAVQSVVQKIWAEHIDSDSDQTIIEIGEEDIV